eukprot:scaffold22635_cov134-Cylindrotheca_fusiformis.AAC.6
MSPPQENLKSVFDRFQHVDGSVTSIENFGSGHINDTYKVTLLINGKDHHGQEKCYILQRINHEVFTRPVDVMDNIRRVTQHLAQKIRARGGDVSRETLTLIPANKDEEAPFVLQDQEDNYWRLYDFISGAKAFEIGEVSNSDNIEGGNPFFEAAAAFARFQRDVADLPPPRLHETIPGFGDSSLRFRQFQEELNRDAKGRAIDCQKEIQFCLSREQDTTLLSNLLKEGRIPERTTHYDTKINNVLLEDETGRGLCVIDLDTVMPGLAIYDFGDCVRAATALAAEDETDLTKVGISMETFRSLAAGYLSVARDFLTPIEVDHLAFAARIVTLTIGLRFLTDHLAGDVYFKTTRENHNLDRARTQLKMVAEMEAEMDKMKAIVEELRACR